MTSNYPDEVPGNAWVLVKETHYVKDNLNPDFIPFTISSQKFCKKNPHSPLKLEIWDWSKSGKHTWISQGFFNVIGILQGTISYVDTYDSKKKFSGRIIIENFKIQKIFSLINLVKKGLQINLNIAVDFTGSNGTQTSSNSLHYINPGSESTKKTSEFFKKSGKFNFLNDYQKAILSIGSILQNYDSDKKIPIFGFGAKWPNVGFEFVNHCFPLTGDRNRIEAEGIEEVFSLYQYAVPQLIFYGPTNFSPCIKKTIEFVEKNQKNFGKFFYSVLLILTDGLITDQSETIDAIIEASNLPISVIIVGIGKEDFSQMEILDADNGVLKGKWKTMRRDIVQFVEFNQFNYDFGALASAVLKELPKQISDYFSIFEQNSGIN